MGGSGPLARGSHQGQQDTLDFLAGPRGTLQLGSSLKKEEKDSLTLILSAWCILIYHLAKTSCPVVNHSVAGVLIQKAISAWLGMQDPSPGGGSER